MGIINKEPPAVTPQGAIFIEAGQTQTDKSDTASTSVSAAVLVYMYKGKGQ